MTWIRIGLKKIRELETAPLIVPRFNVPWNRDQYSYFFANKELGMKLINLLVSECEKNEFDGLVFDAGHLLAMMNGFKENVMEFMIDFSSKMHSKKMTFIIVVSPYVANDDNGFNSKDFLTLAKVVDAFSLMSYDYSRNPGPNAPYNWQMSIATELLGSTTDLSIRSKLLLGLPFYGNDWNMETGRNEPIFGSSYISQLKKHKPKFKWDDKEYEHFYTYSEAQAKHTVYVPTIDFIRKRLELANELGIGISIWELGQALPYFFDSL